MLRLGRDTRLYSVLLEVTCGGLHPPSRARAGALGRSTGNRLHCDRRRRKNSLILLSSLVVTSFMAHNLLKINLTHIIDFM